MKIFINNMLDRLFGHRLYKVDESEYTYRDDLYERVPRELPGKKLDIGSAYGSWAKSNYKDVTTFDQQGDADVRGDVTAMPFKENEFDVIFCFEVLEHVRNPVKAVMEIRRTLKPGGQAFVSTPFFAELHGEEYGDFWRFTRQGLRHVFRDFSKIEVISFGRNELKPHHYLVKAIK